MYHAVTAVYPSPLGELILAANDRGLTGAWFKGQKHFPPSLPEAGDSPFFAPACAWLDRYFSGLEPGPVPPLDPAGTDFQVKVWNALAAIPYGGTVTYGDLAAKLGSGPRAVGAAVGRNPISIFLPCHRVLGAKAALTGYAGGLDRKTHLLNLEAGGPVLPGTRNSRRLAIPGAVLFRSDVPAALTPEALVWLTHLGVRLAIDLRTGEEREKTPCPLPGLETRHLPVTGGNAVPEDAAESYRSMADGQMGRILATLRQAGGALFFCSAGKDRTGVTAALLLRDAGVSREAIIEDYLRSGDNLKDLLQTHLAAHPEQTAVIPRRETMEVFLDWTQR